MSGKSRNPEKPYDKLTVGIAPDSWGVWFPEDDKQVNWQTFLDEAAEAGYEVIETGPFGFLPTDPEVVQRVRRENLSFGEAVSLGVCAPPDAGQPKVGAVIDALAALDKELYVIVEQDLYPCAPDVPLPLAIETRRVLADNHLGIH